MKKIDVSKIVAGSASDKFYRSADSRPAKVTKN